MSADLIRRAAAILRERAGAATPGPWRFWNDGHVGNPSAHIGGIAMPTPESDPARRIFDAAHIATMHPGVGLALARWLEDIAVGWIWDEHPDDVQTPDGWTLTLDESMDRHALDLARLIVGEH